MKNSLKKLPHDERDYHAHHLLGGVVIVPTEPFRVCEPLHIRNQGNDETCTSRAVTAALENIARVELAEEWQWMQTAKVNGIDPQEMIASGVDLRSAVSVPVAIGALERKYCPVSFDVDGIDKCSTPDVYPPILAFNALLYRKKAYLRADTQPTKDIFDSILVTMKQTNHPVVLGTAFEEGWLNETYISDVDPNKSESGHAVEAHALVIKEGVPYLEIQQSAGTNVGNNGVQYLSREAINSGKGFGAYVFLDLTPQELAKVKAGGRQSILNKLSALLSQLFLALTFWKK